MMLLQTSPVLGDQLSFAGCLAFLLLDFLLYLLAAWYIEVRTCLLSPA